MHLELRSSTLETDTSLIPVFPPVQPSVSSSSVSCSGATSGNILSLLLSTTDPAAHCLAGVTASPPLLALHLLSLLSSL